MTVNICRNKLIFIIFIFFYYYRKRVKAGLSKTLRYQKYKKKKKIPTILKRHLRTNVTCLRILWPWYILTCMFYTLMNFTTALKQVKQGCSFLFSLLFEFFRLRLVYCTLYSVYTVHQCTLYSVYTVHQCTLYSIHLISPEIVGVFINVS